MPDVYDVARKIKTLGVVTTLHFDPGQLTVRIRNAAKRMLEAGVASGGWQSQSRKVAELVARHFNVPLLKQHGRYVHVNARRLSREQIQMLCDTHAADLAAWQLNVEVPSWATRHRHGPAQYINDNLHSARTQLQHFLEGRSDYIGFQDVAMAKHAAFMLVEMIDNPNKERCKRAAAYLDSRDLIPIDANF
jgi:hypothetical protein